MSLSTNSSGRWSSVGSPVAARCSAINSRAGSGTVSTVRLSAEMALVLPVPNPPVMTYRDNGRSRYRQRSAHGYVNADRLGIEPSIQVVDGR